MKKISPTDILFSKVRQRILALLYNHPENSFHTNEIIRLTQIGTGAVQRDLEKLSVAGFITIKKIGNQKHYQANRTAPLYPELRGIVLKTFGLADVLRQTLQPIIAEMQIAFIYGSIAKQEDNEKSDIDLMLISSNLSYAEIFPLLETAEIQLNRPIHLTIYSPLEWKKKIEKDNYF